VSARKANGLSFARVQMCSIRELWKFHADLHLLAEPGPCFKELHDKRLRRETFHQRHRTLRRHHQMGRALEPRSKPFIWEATADDIIAKIKLGRETFTRSNRRWSARVRAEYLLRVEIV
jgi:hypothetical protein